MKHLIVLVALVLSTGCAGVDMSSLLGNATSHTPCVVACLACSTALAGTDAPAQQHFACAAHCASCTLSLAADMSEVVGAADVDIDPAPLDVDGPICVDVDR